MDNPSQPPGTPTPPTDTPRPRHTVTDTNGRDRPHRHGPQACGEDNPAGTAHAHQRDPRNDRATPQRTANSGGNEPATSGTTPPLKLPAGNPSYPPVTNLTAANTPNTNSPAPPLTKPTRHHPQQHHDQQHGGTPAASNHASATQNPTAHANDDDPPSDPGPSHAHPSKDSHAHDRRRHHPNHSSSSPSQPPGHPTNHQVPYRTGRGNPSGQRPPQPSPATFPHPPTAAPFPSSALRSWLR